MSETAGVQFPNLDPDGNTRTVQEPLPGTEKYFFSPNVCDETSWYEGASTVTEEVLSDSGDLTTWNSANTNWIDLKHGKVLDEDTIVAADPTYAVKVEVSTDSGSTWTEKTENTWGQTDGDYSVDYAAGTVTFNDALNAGDQVRASYRYAGSFTFTVKPSSGKRLKLNYVEVQFTDDVDPDGDAVFQIRAYDPNDPPNKIVVGQRSYKDMFNYYTESTGPFPTQPLVGPKVVEEVTGVTNIESKVQDGYEVLGTRHDGTNWIALVMGVDPTADRSVRKKIITLPFQYLAFRDLKDSQGGEIQVVLSNGAFGGTKATFTFYCLSESE